MLEMRHSHRLFFTLLPPPRVAAGILAAAGKWPELRGVNLVELERMHVTVHFVGSYAELSESTVAACMAAGDDVSHGSVAVHFDTLSGFASAGLTTPIVLIGETCGTPSLHEAIGSAMQSHGIAPDSRAYLPHVTVSYEGSAIDTRKVDAFGWIADELLLVHSQTGRGYSVLGRWPLR